MAAADEPQGVVEVDVHPGVIQAAGVLRQIAPAGLHHLLVHLHQVDGPDALVPGQLLHHAAVPRTDDQHVLHMGVDGHRHVGDHLVIDELVPLSEHHIAVQGQDLAELWGVVDVDLLVLAPVGVEVPVHPHAVLHVGGYEIR